MARLHRGDPSRAHASSLIVPMNEHLILRGPLGQGLLAAYGPVPQNELFLRARIRPSFGQVIPLQVSAPHSGMPARWYCVVAYPGHDYSFQWVLHHRVSVQAALANAISLVLREGQTPCAVPFFAESGPVLAHPEARDCIADIMHEVLKDTDDRIIVLANDPDVFDALERRLVVVHPPGPGTPVAAEEPQPSPTSAGAEESSVNYDLGSDSASVEVSVSSKDRPRSAKPRR
jgi:hypothetical protein